ncbi:hypothetical protein KAW65_07755 [candidate division WOR-3 bacterium]|nr:hypothetical protein [candidate division WOR-3 bacterium]
MRNKWVNIFLLVLVLTGCGHNGPTDDGGTSITGIQGTISNLQGNPIDSVSIVVKYFFNPPLDTVYYGSKALTLRKIRDFIYPIKRDTFPPPVPTSDTLYQNYPNPFMEQTPIKYALKYNSYMIIKFFNFQEQIIRKFEGDKQPGYYILCWDGKDSLGIPLGSGLYYYQLKVERDSECVFEDIKDMFLYTNDAQDPPNTISDSNGFYSVLYMPIGCVICQTDFDGDILGEITVTDSIDVIVSKDSYKIIQKKVKLTKNTITTVNILMEAE